MKLYLIYTMEGHTIAPNEEVEVENCQMLGEAYGDNPDEAKDNLLKENPWIAEAGFNRSKFIARQLLTNEQRIAIKEVLDYLWEDEKRHYEKCGEPDNHIFPFIKILKLI